VIIVVVVMMAVLVVEGLEGESPMSLLPPSSPLRYMWVIFAHRLRPIDLKLGVQSLQLRLKYTRYLYKRNAHYSTNKK
jgi:hypothetical protein